MHPAPESGRTATDVRCVRSRSISGDLHYAGARARATQGPNPYRTRMHVLNRPTAVPLRIDPGRTSVAMGRRTGRPARSRQGKGLGGGGVAVGAWLRFDSRQPDALRRRCWHSGLTNVAVPSSTGANFAIVLPPRSHDEIDAGGPARRAGIRSDVRPGAEAERSSPRRTNRRWLRSLRISVE